MGANGNVARMSPRQKMINLMYIVLTAMLALNVSSDVLNGFTLVEDGLKRTKASRGLTRLPTCAGRRCRSTNTSIL